jgi:hypothetical protein
MKIFSIISFCTILLLSYSQQNNYIGKNDNPSSLYFGIENRYYINDTLLQNPLIRSNEAEVYKKDKYFFISLILPHRENIHLDVYDIRKNDTIKITTLVLPEKRIPPPAFSIAGKLIGDTISKASLLKAGKFDVLSGDEYLDKHLNFELESFDLEVQGKQFHSISNNLTSSMIYWIKDSKSTSIRIRNDIVFLKTFDKYKRVIYGDKTFYLEK